MTILDEEVQDTRFPDLARRLSHQSVVKHFDAYADVAWDSPEFAIDPADPRWELFPDSPLGGTDWYQALPQELRARIGLHGIVANMKAGLQFESILKRGLLEYAFKLPDGAPEFRYAYHEVIEEAQHSLMFQEFVNRSGLEAPGLTWDMKLGARRVIGMARRFPAHVLRLRARRGGSDRPRAAHRRCAAATRSIRSSSASCASTSPRRPGTSPSPASTCATPCPRSLGCSAGPSPIQAPVDAGHDGRRDDAPAPPARAHATTSRRARWRRPTGGTGRPATPSVTRSARCVTCSSSWSSSRPRRSGSGSASASGRAPGRPEPQSSMATSQVSSM